MTEPAVAISFRAWLTENRGAFNVNAAFNQVNLGLSVVAQRDLPSNETLAQCPFHLAITEESSQQALCQYLALDDVISGKKWSERQWISSYICFHWIIEDASKFAHHAYIQTLPSTQQLRTPLHFTPLELKMFEGTNIYHATLDREREWRQEWKSCQGIVSEADAVWGAKFSWCVLTGWIPEHSQDSPSTFSKREFYLTAATYVSSRAFPSSLLSPNPSLQSSPTTKPVLLPGIDAFNHARGKPVSWVVTYPDSPNAEVDLPNISLVLHTSTGQGQELMNNYGAKPNSEFILGYGFSIPNNPDDTIVLKVGGIDGRKWEVGRLARGVDGLWDEILTSMTEHPDSPSTYEEHLDAAGALAEMVQTLLDRLPDSEDHWNNEIRPEVTVMWRDYVEGQRDILEHVLAFAQDKEQVAIEAAHVEGVEIILETK